MNLAGRPFVQFRFQRSRSAFRSAFFVGASPSEFVVPGPVHPTAAQITAAIARLQSKLEDLAREAGVEASHCSDLECLLEAMPYRVRRRVAVLLQGVQLNAELNGNAAMRTAAGYVLALADAAWAATHNRSNVRAGSGDAPAATLH